MRAVRSVRAGGRLGTGHGFQGRRLHVMWRSQFVNPRNVQWVMGGGTGALQRQALHARFAFSNPIVFSTTGRALAVQGSGGAAARRRLPTGAGGGRTRRRGGGGDGAGGGGSGCAGAWGLRREARDARSLLTPGNATRVAFWQDGECRALCLQRLMLKTSKPSRVVKQVLAGVLCTSALAFS